MLTQLNAAQAHLIARLASEARDARDSLLHGVSDDTVDEPHPAKGEHDRIGSGGFDVLSAEHPAVSALRRAIGQLGPAGRSELFALMRIGQGELAAKDWDRGVSEAETMGDEGVSGLLSDDIDLPSHVEKGLYEVGAI